MVMLGVRSIRSEGKGHVTQVLPEATNPSYIIWLIQNYYYPKFGEFQVQETEKERETACVSTSPSYLSMMTTQTMSDPAHSPITALNSLLKDRAFLMEFFLDILHPAHSLSKNSQLKQGGLSEANAFP